MASCSQARPFSPAQAGDYRQIHDYATCRRPRPFFTGSSSTARRPSRNASSFRPRAASITPSTHSGKVIRLSLDNFLLLRARSSKSQLRFVLVLCHACDQAFYKWTREMNVVAPTQNALWFTALKASVAAAASRSASAQLSQSLATALTTAGFVVRIARIDRLPRAMAGYPLSNPLPPQQL